MVKTLCIVVLLSTASCFAWASLPVEVAAQEEAPTERARRLFEEGLALAQSDRWAEALSAFRRSADLVPRPSTSYNIANALYRLDRPVEGLEQLERYEAMPEVQRSESARARGASLRRLLERAVAELRLTVTPADAEVFVDGRRVEGSGAEREVPMNPGSHLLRVSHARYESERREVEVERGGSEAYRITLTPKSSVLSASAAVPASGISYEPGSGSEPREDETKRFVKRPAFWAMIGAVAAVGIGAGLAVALSGKSDSTQCGTTGSCATTQGLSVASF